MTKKQRYFDARSTGHDHPEACKKANLRNRATRYHYRLAWEKKQAFDKGFADAQAEAEIQQHHARMAKLAISAAPGTPVSRNDPTLLKSSPARVAPIPTAETKDLNVGEMVNTFQPPPAESAWERHNANMAREAAALEARAQAQDSRNVVGDPYGREFYEDLAQREYARSPWPADLVNGTWSQATGFVLDSDVRDAALRARFAEQANEND